MITKDEVEKSRDEYLLRLNQLRNFNTVLDKSMPTKRYHQLMVRLSGYIVRKANAEQEFRAKLKKYQELKPVERPIDMLP